MTVDAATDLPLLQIVVAATAQGGIGRGTLTYACVACFERIQSYSFSCLG